MRTLGAVLLGYAVTFTATFLALGAEGVFRPGSYEPSSLWIGLSFLLGFLAAIVGGVVCTVVAESPRAPKILAAVVLGLGLLLAIPVLTRPPLPPRVPQAGSAAGRRRSMTRGRPRGAAGGSAASIASPHEQR